MADSDTTLATLPNGVSVVTIRMPQLETANASVFVRCGLAETDPAFVRYPPLPVRVCRGYRPGQEFPALDL